MWIISEGMRSTSQKMRVGTPPPNQMHLKCPLFITYSRIPMLLCRQRFALHIFSNRCAYLVTRSLKTGVEALNIEQHKVILSYEEWILNGNRSRATDLLFRPYASGVTEVLWECEERNWIANLILNAFLDRGVEDPGRRSEKLDPGLQQNSWEYIIFKRQLTTVGILFV